MARKSKPVQEQIELAQQAAAVIATTADHLAMPAVNVPVHHGDAFEPPVVTAADTDFNPPAEPAKHVSRLAGITRDDRNGISIDVERERKPGQVSARVLIRFHEGHLPVAEEKALLRDEGFSWKPDEKAWGAPKSAAALILAKKAVNEICKFRGDMGPGLYI